MSIERQHTRRLARLYADHAPRAGRLAFLLVGDRDLAEDIVQEAFVRVAGRFWSLHNAEAFEAYLRRTVVNLCRGHMRKLRVERGYLERQPSGDDHYDAPFQDLLSRDEMFAILNRLPYKQRAAVVLRYYGDHTEHQTAEILGCPVGTVESLVSRGLSTLRTEMRGED
jgi:RNA polymerase sigma-70 factor (sigma-E family)